MSDNKSVSQFPAPGVVLVLLALGVVVFSDNPFKPSRPDAPTPLTSTAENVQARLWQDPFAAVEEHRKSKHKESEHKKSNTSLINAIDSGIVENTKYFGRQHRICSFFNEKNTAMFDKLPDSKNVANKKAGIKYRDGIEVRKPKNTTAHSVDELRCQIQRDVEINNELRSDVHVIAVMVPGGPYAEDHETRIRSRYAVIAGLSSAGYVPSDSEHIGYIDFTSLCSEAFDGSQLKSIYCDWPATIPYEWFERQETYYSETAENRFADNVLVLWLDDGEIAQVKPLYMLERLRNAVTPGPHERFVKIKTAASSEYKDDVRIKFDVVGPAGSTTLVKMFREASGVSDEVCKKDYPGLCGDKKTRIISARATIDDEAIESMLNISLADESASWPKIYRTIPTDKELVESLLCELLRRGVNPYWWLGTLPPSDLTSTADSEESNKRVCGNYSTSALNKNNRQDHIILIGEWDTEYSRNFNRLFRDLIDDYSDGGDLQWLHSYNYFRGIDGSIGQGEDKSSFSDEKDENGKSKKSFRRAVGANQFDYLRRLGDQLADLSATIKESGTIRALGIVGSDTYDKLLILQALRNRLPDVIFFTTDLDARMLHKEENDWARNLVVASGYGLNPENEQFKGVLPFRDSYQTSLYLATKQATKCEIYKSTNSTDSNKEECLSAYDIASRCADCNKKEAGGGETQVKIFEIGNKSAVDYSENSPILDGSRNKEKISDDHVAYYSCLFLAILLLILLSYQTSSFTRKYINLSAFVALVVYMWVASFDTADNVEFHTMLSGTSIWPALVIRMVAAVLALLFIIYALRSLRSNANHIIVDHELAFEPRVGLVDRICVGLKKLSLEQRNFALIINVVTEEVGKSINEVFVSIKNLLTVILKSFVSVIGVILPLKIWSGIGGNNARSHDIKYETPSVWAHLFISLWNWRYDVEKEVSINDLMYQYWGLGKTRWWLVRVLSMCFLYFYLTYKFIFSFPNLPFTPFSGEASAVAQFIILWAVLIPYIFLIFLVVDITRLNSRFVEMLSKCRVKWPGNVISKYCSEFGVDEDVAVEKLKMDLIVQRSRAVDVLIFLPFIVLSLLIISRSSYFDRWHMPWHLALVILLGAGIALSSAIRLRQTAKKARREALENLTKKYKVQSYEESKSKSPNKYTQTNPCKNRMAERIKVIIEDIETINAGPFLPIARHPIVTAVAMPFGGVGGLYLIDYLAGLGA